MKLMSVVGPSRHEVPKASVGRFRMHSGHGWSGCWLDPVANDPTRTCAEEEDPTEALCDPPHRRFYAAVAQPRAGRYKPIIDRGLRKSIARN
jgi:hypothetical protein